MKTKTIENILNTKFDLFLRSIGDPHVKALVKDGTIITGGCITSMLLNEDVNDYDLYFKDFKTALAVADHYVKGFLTINKYGSAPPTIVVDHTPDYQIKITVVNSGIATLPIDRTQYPYLKDLTDEEAKKYISEIPSFAQINSRSYKKTHKPICITSNAITLGNDIQLIIRFYGTAEEIHKNYDFIHCTNYWTSWDKKLVLNAGALTSILEKDLHYTGSAYPLSSIIRTRKFIKRGWAINAGQYLKMAFQLNDLDLKDIKVLADQLVGVDMAYFHELVSALMKTDKKDINSTYIAGLIDKIF